MIKTQFIYQDETEYVPYTKTVNVTEHRAATDESVRLLNEMQEKAKSNLIATIHIKENYVEAIAMYYWDEVVSNRMNFQISFKLNGEKHEIKDYVDNFEWSQEIAKKYNGLGRDTIFIMLHKKLSEMIALELMKQSPDFMEHYGNNYKFR